MAHNLAIKAVATSADGFYYREEHEWRDVNDKGYAWITGKLKDAQATLAKYSANKQSDQISMTLVGTFDGVAIPDVLVPGLSREEVAKFEIAWAEWYLELAKISLKEARDKDKRRGWK